MSTNAIYDALLALGASVTTASTGPMIETGRRLKLFDKAQKPALFQVEPDDNIASKLGQLQRRTLEVTWIIYHSVGKDQSTVPARATADIKDAVLGLFPTANGRLQTLGGLVVAAYVNGRIRSFEGDIDGQTIITIPLTILVP